MTSRFTRCISEHSSRPRWLQSRALGDNADFEQRTLGNQFCNADRSPGGVCHSDKFVFHVDERVQVFPQTHVIGSHFDDVVEAKTGSLEMRPHESERISKLSFWIIG